MKQYNRSLDYVILAMAEGRKGDHAMAAKLFAKAITASDAVRAIAVLEASNKQAAGTKTATKTQAAKRIKANDEFDMGDADMDDLVGDEPVESAMEEDEDMEDNDGEFDEQFAKVLSSMSKAKRR